MNKRHPEPWRELLIDELTDETEEERRDFQDPDRNPFESKHGPTMGTDGDDNPAYTQPRIAFDVAKLERGDISDPVRVKPPFNPAGQIVAAGHGFIIDDQRSRPWKTAKRTHCAHCGGQMPAPKVTARKYECEFDSVPLRSAWTCECSGCELRQMVLMGSERNKGQPRKCCSPECTRLRDNENKKWKRAVARAEKRGELAPSEPHDRGAGTHIKRARVAATTQERFPVRHDLRRAKSALVPWTVPFWAADPWLKFVRAGAVPIGRGQTINYADPVGGTASNNVDDGPSLEPVSSYAAPLAAAA